MGWYNVGEHNSNSRLLFEIRKQRVAKKMCVSIENNSCESEAFRCSSVSMRENVTPHRGMCTLQECILTCYICQFTYGIGKCTP